MFRNYRGKVVYGNDEWTYGYLSAENVIFQDNKMFIVIPESVGQWTGKYDKNKVKIYEKDIVKYEDNYYKVEYDCVLCLFYLIDDKDNIEYLAEITDYDLEVIGNDFMKKEG